jgi:alpha-glucosidase
MTTESAICPESSIVCPYLFDLGVDAVWLSLIFPSPKADFGYDITNYLDVDPIFGTPDDFDRLVAAAQARPYRTVWICAATKA